MLPVAIYSKCNQLGNQSCIEIRFLENWISKQCSCGVIKALMTLALIILADTNTKISSFVGLSQDCHFWILALLALGHRGKDKERDMIDASDYICCFFYLIFPKIGAQSRLRLRFSRICFLYLKAYKF